MALVPSRIARAFVALSGAATLALALAIPLPPAVQAAVVLWTALTMLRALRTIAPRELRLRDREIEWIEGGCHRRGFLRDGSFVAPWLTVIRWRPESALFDRTALILPDMLERERFRELRVQVKWSG